MLDVAIIGLDPDWESTYQPALRKLDDRMRVRVVWDAVAPRAEQAATDLQAAPCAGILRTLALPSIQAVLVLGDTWCRDALLSFLMQHKKPSLVADVGTAVRAGELYDFANTDARMPMMVPGFSQRYTPATSRLRELMATRLGAAQEIDIQFHPPQQCNVSQTQLTLIDWCQYLVGKHAAAQHSTAKTKRLEFPPSKSHTTLALARITLSDTPSIAPNGFAFTAAVTCERGTATLRGTNEITWTHAGDQRTETLEGERDGVVVLLDLFCRRVMGGLVPIPTIDDLLAAEHLANEH